MSESETLAQMSWYAGFTGTLRLSEQHGKNRMVCTITMAAVSRRTRSRKLLYNFMSAP